MDDDVAFLRLLAHSPDPGIRAAAVEALDDMALKWTYNPNQQRGFGGRFGNGTGTAQQPGPPKVKPANPAAVPRKATNPAMPAPPLIYAPAATPPPKPVAQAGHEATPGTRTSTTSASRDQTLTVGHRSTTQTRIRDARTAAVARTARAVTRADLAAAKARIAAMKRKAPTKAQRDAAVKAMQKREGIPSKMPKGTSSARRKAATAMASATRKLVTYNAQKADATAKANALRDEIKTSKQPGTQAWAKTQLAKQTAALAKINAQIKATSAQYTSARKTWRS